MRVSINVPGVSIQFDQGQLKPFIKEQAKELFDRHVVPLMIRATCKALELIANNAADAHDHLIGQLKSKQSA